MGHEMVEFVEVLERHVQLQSLPPNLFLVCLEFVVVSAHHMHQLQQLRGLLSVRLMCLRLCLVEVLPLKHDLLLLAHNDVLHLAHSSRQAIFFISNSLKTFRLSNSHPLDHRELFFSKHVQSLFAFDSEHLLLVVQLLPLPQKHLVRVQILLVHIGRVVGLDSHINSFYSGWLMNCPLLAERGGVQRRPAAGRMTPLRLTDLSARVGIGVGECGAELGNGRRGVAPIRREGPDGFVNQLRTEAAGVAVGVRICSALDQQSVPANLRGKLWRMRSLGDATAGVIF
jgi:hypothetical protein